MKVGLISYPMLFQKKGGLQIQVKETLAALLEAGMDADIFDPLSAKLEDYDVIHVFSANHGNYNIVAAAKEAGCKVVMSPLAEDKWNRKIAFRSRLIDKVLRRLSSYLNYSFYSQVAHCFKQCDHLVALGEGEKIALNTAFDVANKKISIVKNGIPERFFNASPTLIKAQENPAENFILNVGTINENKNQLTLAEALKEYLPEQHLILIGPVSKSNEAYLQEILALGNSTYLGELEYDSPLLTSVYAAGAVFALPSTQEVYPLSALEALAAGTPVVVTKVSSMNFDCTANEFQLVTPSDKREIADKITNALNDRPSPSQCKNLVSGFSWQQVAQQLIVIYKSL